MTPIRPSVDQRPSSSESPTAALKARSARPRRDRPRRREARGGRKRGCVRQAKARPTRLPPSSQRAIVEHSNSTSPCRSNEPFVVAPDGRDVGAARDGFLEHPPCLAITLLCDQERSEATKREVQAFGIVLSIGGHTLNVGLLRLRRLARLLQLHALSNQFVGALLRA